MKILEACKKNVACIYKLNFPNGKSYIGKTKNFSKRVDVYNLSLKSGKRSKVYDAIEEFGLDNIDVEFLAEPKNLSKDDLVLVLAILEISYIRKFDTITPNGYNISIGGEVLGIPSDCISTENRGIVYSGGYKPVLVYDLDGNFVEEFESIEKCAYNFGVDSSLVSASLGKRREAFHGKYMLREKRYGITPKTILPFQREHISKVVVNKVYEDRIVERKVFAPKNTVLKYDLDGNFCGEYDTAYDAAISIGKKTITKGVICGGYIFFDYGGGEIKQNIGVVKSKSVRLPKYSEALEKLPNDDLDLRKNKGWSCLINDFGIGQYDLDGNLVAKYPSIKNAAYETDIPYSCIWACVFGKTRKSYGYVWRKIEE